MNVTPELVANAWPCTERVDKAVIAERERIIALLEMQLETIRDSRLNGIVVLSSAIALVRGGNE